jgi:hypothetical protein
MKRILTIGAFVAALPACLLLSAMAEEPSVAGKWSGTATGIAGSRQTREEFSMELRQKGQDVTGTYSSKVEIGHGPRGGPPARPHETGLSWPRAAHSDTSCRIGLAKPQKTDEGASGTPHWCL